MRYIVPTNRRARFLVGDLRAQAAWLREHDLERGGGRAALSELGEVTGAAYALWFFAGCVTGFHWLYLATKARVRHRDHLLDGAQGVGVGGPPPPPHLICGLTGKVMEDPHTLRTVSKGLVAADTAQSKMFGCAHTFSGQALFHALRQERKCPRCGIKPYTLHPEQVSLQHVAQLTQVHG